MTPLQRLEHLDSRISELQAQLPRLQTELPPAQMRQQLFGDLGSFWSENGPANISRQQQLQRIRLEQLHAELDLRQADNTLPAEHAALVRACLELPLPWQRQHLPTNQQPQLFRPVFNTLSPNRRVPLPGVLVVIASDAQGANALPETTNGAALLCSISHGIEAFDSLAQLHTELCERLDDPWQSLPLLSLLSPHHPVEGILLADRLRYEWCAEALTEQQTDSLIERQHACTLHAWQTAWQGVSPPALPTLEHTLRNAMDLLGPMGSRHALATRYSLLLEKHLPSWLRQAPPQALSHVMQTLQELAVAIEQGAAPGILDLQQFNQRENLISWTRSRLRERLRRDPGLDLAPERIQISVTLARQVGALLNPLQPSSYVAVANTQRHGGSIELVKRTYPLDELALMNIAWFDTDYWLTARVHDAEGNALPSLSAARVKDMVRELDVGTGYTRFVRKHLLDSLEGGWRERAHGRINKARMHAELVKAHYARHLLEDPFQRGYHWARAVLEQPNSETRSAPGLPRLSVRQLLILTHTVTGVLLINAEASHLTSLLVYAPDAPDRRPWREYHNARALLRDLRENPALRAYVIARTPLANAQQLEKLLSKGRLGPHVQRPTIKGDLLRACYRAEVQDLLARADAQTRSNRELLGHVAIDSLHLLLDLVSLVLPYPALSALAFARAAVSVIEGLEALERTDREAALHHALGAFSHTIDAIHGFAGSAVMRRALRGLPPRPPIPIPDHYVAKPDVAKLRYRTDGIHGEGIYEWVSGEPGPTRYFIRDEQGRHYNVSFDGYRWRAVEPGYPEAYLQLPVRRDTQGQWVLDSALHWHDGLPDLGQLFDDCHLGLAAPGTALDDSLFDADGQLYLRIANWQLPVRRHLLPGHLHLQVPTSRVPVWAVLRNVDGQWRIRVRQAGRSSDWLAMPT